MQKRINVYYSGRVQGVGFRFTAENVARHLGVTGWVMNMPDGRVEVVCEGSKEKLNLFLKKVKSLMDDYIAKEDINWMDASGEFESFEIRFF